MSALRAPIRRTHEERVLSVLRERGALSRGEIAKLVGLSRSTLSEITGTLLQRGAIVVVDTDAANRAGSGRPAERLALDPGSGQFMGVDFGHRRVRVVVADAAHEIVASGVERYDDREGWPTRLATAFALVDRLGAESGVHYRALQGIGIGVPGPYPAFAMSAKQDVFPFPVRHPADGVDTAFSERFGAPVVVDNNTRFAALAEAIHSSGPVADLLYVRVSDGVGGGLVVGGRLATGSIGLAGEIGHVTAVLDGRPCRCGKRGCVETVASVPALLTACRERGVPVDSLDDLRAAVERAHPVVDQVLRYAATILGRVVGTLVMALNPAEVVVGGEIAQFAPVIVQQLAAGVKYQLFPEVQVDPQIRAAELADDDGARGALAALFNDYPAIPGRSDFDAASRGPSGKEPHRDRAE
ncbi:ROK family transcriptional regulator [Saccharopolyspora phatthalungensis]|uniref:Putative NBD/HSP70 family sugar kinase n=1 Tax=Saccharopolyspora phatthalungensis TaxID=664693 RepID=A0A840QIP3_9PSEU|nr:ROK family transcriptional regulator [Saccharopolyspora phatthalungensis]MBB5160030.1 putative NBD/HSP70 family sugar kinase [Saccharopolyspora phatthalungensis]